MGIFRKRAPTMKNEKVGKEIIKMINTYGEHYYRWDGKLYNSDIVRACIRPKVKAIGKLNAKHIKGTGNDMKIDPDANIKFLLAEPNPFMTAQQFQEKMATQLILNNNAFALIVRDENGKPIQLYPIPCDVCETLYKNEELYLKFSYRNGKSDIFIYTDIIHLRQDFYDNDIFGTSPVEALRPMMEVIGTIDQGIIKAIKNSGLIRWLLTFNQSMREEDIKKNVENFVNNYLNIESDTFGAAGVDAKATATRIEPKDYVPNAAQTKTTVERIYSFFNTNEKIVQSKWTEDEWNAYYEAEIEPFVIQAGQVYTVRLFSRRERGCNNQIIFSANNLMCASLKTKLELQGMVDRGAMSINEWRIAMNLEPVKDGDVFIRRLDTQVVNLTTQMLNKMTEENFSEVAEMINKLLSTTTAERRKDEAQSEYQGKSDTE